MKTTAYKKQAFVCRQFLKMPEMTHSFKVPLGVAVRCFSEFAGSRRHTPLSCLAIDHRFLLVEPPFTPRISLKLFQTGVFPNTC